MRAASRRRIADRDFEVRVLNGGDVQPAYDQDNEPECVRDRSMRPLGQPRAEKHARAGADENGDDIDDGSEPGHATSLLDA
jgi:hypothetical protein